ncbi:retrovirus-related pol polyprotein from transposon gypsy [Plakobranchus ocellatus]|uniref:Retrovirus-related pol polyprotein from transposon gypsy n=1 Tax=Plakobranchus ocellatus TaxID=259542 RepID=A0AAV4D8N3_9GAST|nr:retrovirus-related pol polyprotein from transposon gypsy [Plakobranchus ocellatus]
MTLNYFNTEKATTIEVDSSLVGMGASLIQEGRPIAFASKFMTETESRYANIKRELLAVVFALERFHTYVYGKHVTIFSDHKPLENIQYKNLAKAPPRLQRLLLRIQPYNSKQTWKRHDLC